MGSAAPKRHARTISTRYPAHLQKIGNLVPNRLLRDGVCTSDAINALSADAEVLFYRLLVVADDFGYMDARIAILKAQCYPLKDSATSTKIENWLQELANAGLIYRYQLEGKPFLAVNKWEQRVRSRPKYAAPTDDGCQSIDGHMSDKAQTYDGLGKGKGKGKGAAKTLLPDDWFPSNSTITGLGREFRLRVPEDINRYVSAFRDACKAKGYQYADFEAAFRNCVRQDWPKFRGKDGKISDHVERVNAI